ncbi:MAG: hypothetical protein A3E78_03760 [Alphaproteobacteria bacterium RIFCSPHIGHO2_12_FULL_63_12]|nr:MAG: hypothetical protein A3E78_03760 [Alphaproteobacteria bacterium RIFCSPHIGHO2_12_FULL_63_12]
MIDPLAFAAQSQDAAPRRKDDAARSDAAGFSYALAAAAIEKNAAQSLKIHGATPKNAAAATSAAPTGEARADKVAAKNGAHPEAKASSQAAIATVAQTDAAAAKTASAAPAPAKTAPALVAPGASAAPAMLAAKADGAGIRDLAAAKTKNAAVKAPKLQPPTPALKAEFAEILARRLEKTSVFDLRLDPPELGRIDGRLSVKDDGKAVLSLSFDNQAAFDHFSRDEQALRLALTNAGLNFAAGDFVFAFKERPQASAPQEGFALVPVAEAGGAYEPLFLADWSAGALDIRI